MRLLIDADSIVYGAGFSAQKKLDDGTIDPGPVEFSLNAVRQALGSLEHALSEKLKKAGDTINDFDIFLTGKNNFRFTIATIRPYKGNRDPAHKPKHYDAMRTYLVDKWKARVVNGYEADDAVAMAQLNSEYESTIICSIDKDLKTVPGLNYNFRTKVMSIISPLQAKRAFWTQVLTGDPTDNIGGAYKVGPKKAGEVLGLIKGVVKVAEFERFAYNSALEVYDRSIRDYGEKTGYAALGAEKAVLENARLLHMQEYPGQLWVPPGAKMDWLPGYDIKSKART